MSTPNRRTHLGRHQRGRSPRAWFENDHRVRTLDDQMNRWLRANQIRAYAAALQATSQSHNTQDDEAPDAATPDELTSWISWMLTYADTVDPLLPAPQGPVPHQPSPEDLRPYLTGWSPYGPESGR